MDIGVAIPTITMQSTEQREESSLVHLPLACPDVVAIETGKLQNFPLALMDSSTGDVYHLSFAVDGHLMVEYKRRSA